MFISVIVPTFNRRRTLKICIESLFDQNYSKDDFEVIVIDDGSNDGTEQLVSLLKIDSPVALRYFKQNRSGPGCARNRGIDNARGDIILFIGDDIIASFDLLREHQRIHSCFSGDNLSVLGYITWYPEIKITNFMRWLEKEGLQFGYPLIKDPGNVPYNFFYTSNVSVKKKFLLKCGVFDEDFHFAAFEDIELAYRLFKAGLRIVYNEKAAAYHKHEVTKADYNKKLRIAGESMAIFHYKHPELKNEFVCADKLRRWEFFKWSLSYFAWRSPFFIENLIPLKLLYRIYRYICWRYISDGYRRKVWNLFL